MAAQSATARSLVARWHSQILLAAAVMTSLLIIMGGTVCVTESAAGCPDWPGCYGRVVPPPQTNAIIEYLHRLIAALTSPLILAAAAVGWQRSRRVRWVSRPPVIAIPFLIAVIIFGALAVLRGLSPVAAAIDVGSALIVLALIVTATVAALARQVDSGLPDRFSARSALTRTSLAALIGVFLVYVSGVLVAGKGSPTRCLSWPAWRVLPGDLPGWPQTARLALAVVSALLIVVAVRQAWHSGGARRQVAVLAGLAFLAEMVAGSLLLAGRSTAWLMVAYVALAALLYVLLVVLASLSALAGAAVSVPSPGGAPQTSALTPLD